VSRGVDLSYRVLDDYIQQGQQAARLMRDRSYGPDALRNDVQDLTARGFQYASDITEVLLAVFFELLPSAARGQTGPLPFSPPAASAGWSGGETPPASEGPVTSAPSAEQVTGRARVALQVESVRPATVTVDLQPRAAGASLVCHDLRTADPSKPRLAAAAIDGGSGEEPVAVRIRIPPEQPPGTYRGEVIDTATSLPAGSVVVHLGP
jgi:hypothetical protein